jgi:hypothetical protein
MECFFETVCHKCGQIDEAKFSLGSTHLKQICNGCGAYIKFFDKNKVPPVPEIKLRIWAICSSDIELINKLKKEILFPENTNGLYQKVAYWKLYLAARKHQAYLFQ